MESSSSSTRREATDGAAPRGVLDCLAGAEGPLGALDIARRTHLSTLVIIPVLGHLAEAGLVARECHTTGAGGRNPTWGYVITPRGARSVGRAVRPTG